MRAKGRIYPAILTIVSAVLLFNCSGGRFNEAAYKNEIRDWKNNRLERLKSVDGWVNLCGLSWLKNGVNSIGSDSSNTIIFPVQAPAKIGTITLTDSIVYIHFNNTEGYLVDDKPAVDCKLINDAVGSPTHVQLGRYVFTIIRRGSKYGIRLRDMESPLLGKLDSIPSYPVSSKWRVRAKLEKFPEPKTFEVNTVIGIPEKYKAEGKLVFKLSGKELSLIPFEEDGAYFIIMGDETSSFESYAAGRFLQAKKVDSTGYTILDFNKATNPPCAFTAYATCPLPPRENILEARVEAGEKDVHLHKD